MGTRTLKINGDLFAQLLKGLGNGPPRYFKVDSPLPADAEIVGAGYHVGKDCVELVLKSESWVGNVGEVTPTVTAVYEPREGNEPSVFLHPDGLSTERHVAVAAMRELGKDVEDFRLRDKIISLVAPWIDYERKHSQPTVKE